MKFLFWSLSYIVVFSAAAMSQSASEKNPDTRTVDEGPRQFDFWVGEWDVNLRVNNKGQWVDRTKARCTIYEILDGKAIMELWNAPQIKGFSIRYYNPGTRNWSLWLNWPGNNSSRWFNLSGSFRHGRGEFYTSFVNNGDSILSRYTFSDITPNSLRWDDGFSKDKGLT